MTHDELFEQNKRLLYHVAKRYQSACERDPAVDSEDLIQAGFLGLAAAQEAWEPDRGSWSNVAIMYVKNAMRAALGINGSRIRAEHGAISLDKPLADGEDCTLMDVLEDTSLPDIDTVMMQNDLQRQVRRAVANTRHPVVVQRHDLEGQSYKSIGRELGIGPDEVRRMRQRVFTDLRRNHSLRHLIDMETRFYAHKGVAAFNRDWTSVTEAAALWRIEARAKHEKTNISEV